MENATSASFDAYVIYLYIVLGLPMKEIADHQGVPRTEIDEIIHRYGFNFKNTYGVGQHFKAYPKGKLFKLKSGKTISLDITQDFVESYVKSGMFYDNSFEDFINRYFEQQAAQTEQKPKAEPKEKKHKSTENRPKKQIAIPKKLKTVLKISAFVIIVALLVLFGVNKGCITFKEPSCVGNFPSFDGETEKFELNFTAIEDENLPIEFSVLEDGAYIGTINFSTSENPVISIEAGKGNRLIEITANGERSNPISADTNADTKMYIVVSMEGDRLHISQTSE